MVRRVLIVDDSQTMRDVLTKYLTNFNLEIAGSAKDGAEAIELFSQLQPDIVTLDITMPKLDGVSVLKEIKKQKPDCYVIIVSAITDKSIVLKAMDAGATLFIHKPVNETSVHAAIEKILKKFKQ